MNKKYFNPDNLYVNSLAEIAQQFEKFRGNEDLYFSNAVHDTRTGKRIYQIYDNETGDRVGEVVIEPNDPGITGYEGKFRAEFHLIQDREH